MSRPTKRRYVSPAPRITEFWPVGMAPEELRRLVLPLDGLEALRLTDLVGLEQAEAARQMGVSRQTFGRILAAARRIATQALVGGLALRIEATASVEVKAHPVSAVPGGSPLTRVAVSAHAASLEAAVAPRFGQAPGFLIVDPTTMDFEYVSHVVSTDRTSNRGVDAAALVSEAGVTVLLTGFVGAKAARALSQAGIRVVDRLGGLTAREALERLLRGELLPISPDEVAMPAPTG
jgi:predicted DNA-binding protein (UPF0251 family)/predicted Fe-Mo cluster-binding NifX family protein